MRRYSIPRGESRVSTRADLPWNVAGPSSMRRDTISKTALKPTHEENQQEREQDRIERRVEEEAFQPHGTMLPKGR